MARCKVLILGGYGTFGGRLAHLLGAVEGVQLIITGRSHDKAAEFCATLPQGFGHAAAAIDRDGDLAAQIAPLVPQILVDASGPFQAYGDAPYRVVQVALELGIHYLDLADGADFVAGIGQFDDAAQRRGIFILSGVSSFPVLTAAVVRHLMRGLANLDSVRGGIAPSPYAGVGLNVIRAIASYAGKPVRLLRNGKTAHGHALTDSMRFTIAPPGRLPLRPILFSLVDVPDLRAIPEQWPGLRDIWMGAGPVPEILHRGLGLLAWLVRLRLVTSLTPLAGMFYWAINRLRWGEHRGGMFVAIAGRDADGTKVARSWHLLAEGDDGPLIPSMAAEAVIRNVLAGRTPRAGARAATAELELADYHALFGKRRIHDGVRQDSAGRTGMPLYRRILGEAWEALPPLVRDMHDMMSHRLASGQATVTRGAHPVARLIAMLFRFPPAGEHVPVTVEFTAKDGYEIWRRDFAGHAFHSIQRAGQGGFQHMIAERFGPFEFGLALVLDGDRMNLVLRGWRFLGLPLPLSWAPRGEAYETARHGRFRFCVEIGHPLCGRIVRYEGWLIAAAAS